MSFHINWSAFSSQSDFQNHIRELLTNALNKSKPHILEDRIKVTNLDWGSEAPRLELLEVGDIAADRFRGVFKLNYTGGATITISTKIQANLLNVWTKSNPSSFTTPKYAGATESFPIPLHLTLRNIRLQGTVIVVFSKVRGLTLVFRNDPLQGIDVSSSFDNFPIIATFLQQQIETQIRTLFREEVPSVLYQLSLKYLPSASGLSQQMVTRIKPEHVVKIAEVDYERPVSLMNILHVEAMLNSRRTLALNTPIMPTAIVRSELKHWQSLAFPHATMLNIGTDDTSVYDQIYAQSKHLAPKSTRNHKRRIVKINKKKKEAEGTSLTDSDIQLPPVVPVASAPAQPELMQPLEPTPIRSNSEKLFVEPTKNEENETTPTRLAPTKSVGKDTSSGSSKPKSKPVKIKHSDIDDIASEILLERLHKRLASSFPSTYGAHIGNPYGIPFSTSPSQIGSHPLYITQRLPISPFLRDSKVNSNSPSKVPHHYVFPQAGFGEPWGMHGVEDSPPPAYNA